MLFGSYIEPYMPKAGSNFRAFILCCDIPDMRLFPSVGASGFPDLISRQAFCGGSLGLRHQCVYELLQGTPLTEVTQASWLPRSHPSTKYTSPSCLSDETVYKLTHVEEVLQSSRNSVDLSEQLIWSLSPT
jgi:hypothetical protein